MEGLFYMYVSIYVFQKHVKSRKIYMYVDYTHDQLNTTHFIIVFRIFFEGGAQNLSLPPGARYGRYATSHSLCDGM